MLPWRGRIYTFYNALNFAKKYTRPVFCFHITSSLHYRLLWFLLWLGIKASNDYHVKKIFRLFMWSTCPAVVSNSVPDEDAMRTPKQHNIIWIWFSLPMYPFSFSTFNLCSCSLCSSTRAQAPIIKLRLSPQTKFLRAKKKLHSPFLTAKL